MYEDPTVYYWRQEHITVGIPNRDWNYQDDDKQSASEAAQRRLEDEYGLPVSDTSVGTGAAAPGWLIYIPGAIASGALWLFFQGEKIQPNIEAWKQIYKNYLSKFFKRQPSFDRGGAAIIAILALSDRLGQPLSNLSLVSYKKRSKLMEQSFVVPGDRGDIDSRERIEAATIHVFEVEANGMRFVIHIHGSEVTLIK